MDQSMCWKEKLQMVLDVFIPSPSYHIVWSYCRLFDFPRRNEEERTSRSKIPKREVRRSRIRNNIIAYDILLLQRAEGIRHHRCCLRHGVSVTSRILKLPSWIGEAQYNHQWIFQAPRPPIANRQRMRNPHNANKGMQRMETQKRSERGFAIATFENQWRPNA